MYTPRTISSSVRRAQSAASRLVRRVLMITCQPRLRTTAFQVLEGVFVMVATVCSDTGVPKMYRVTQGLKAESFCLVELIGAQGQNRTADTGIFSPLLYRLSYLGIGGQPQIKPGWSPRVNPQPDGGT